MHGGAAPLQVWGSRLTPPGHQPLVCSILHPWIQSHLQSPLSDHSGQPVSPRPSSWILTPRCPTPAGLVVPTWLPPRLHVLGDPGPWRVLLCRARWSVNTA